MSTVLWCSTRSATSWPISGVPGVRYGAMGTSPMNTSISGIMHVGGFTPATAKAVACGGWQCTVATARGWRFMICKCIRISLVCFFVPQSWLPSRSTKHMCSDFMKPLEQGVGGQVGHAAAVAQQLFDVLGADDRFHAWQKSGIRPVDWPGAPVSGCD